MPSNSFKGAALFRFKGGRVSFPAVGPSSRWILEEIRDCNCFIADVTELNPNVLFELGYAIAHRKRVWLLLDVSIERAKLEFGRFQIFSTVGYNGAANSEKIG
jgi:nucleoside 2-deoxyribosyltransferase